MADVGLDRLLREKEAVTDLPVDETVGDELQNLDLACGGLLLELTEDGRGERDHGACAAGAPTCRGGLEPSTVVAITVQDLLPLSGIHDVGIGAAEIAL